MVGKLIYLSKNGEEKGELVVSNLHFFIGSDLFCDLRIKHKDIAAQHCMITSQKDKPALIRNLSRTVPILINNTEIGTTDVELKDQDVITVRHKKFKWCFVNISELSTSSQTTFSTAAKNRKSWPLFKNKLVAVVSPQKRDEEPEIAVPKRRRGTVGGSIPSRPKIVALKTGLRVTKKNSYGKQKSSVNMKIAQAMKTPQLARKSVKFLDVLVPRLGKRGWNSNDTPYLGTPSRPKVSLYSTPASTLKLRLENEKPVKGILKTPVTRHTRKETNQVVSQPTVPSILIEAPSVSMSTSSQQVDLALEGFEVSDNDTLRTPTKRIQPAVVMRSSRRRAAFVISPPSTPKSTTKKRKSAEEKSNEALERAAKRLKSEPPHAIDGKKRAALLQCHRKSITPHPQALKRGKLITKFPSSFNSRLITSTPSEKTAHWVKGKTRLSKLETIKYESVKFSNNLPNVFRFSSLGEPNVSELTLGKDTDTSVKEAKPAGKKSLSKFSLNTVSSPSLIFKKVTRASKAANASRELQRRENVDDVLSALDLSRKWPPSTQENLSTSSEVNLSGLKKLFNIDKALDAKDVRELFLEKNVSTDKSLVSLPEEHSNRTSRCSTLSKATTFDEEEESGLLNSFYSEGAQEQPCSSSLLNSSPLSGQSYSSTSRRSLSLKSSRKSTTSNDASTSWQLMPISGELSGKQKYWNSDNEESVVNSVPFKATRSQNIQLSTSIDKLLSPEWSTMFSSTAKPSGSKESEITHYTTPLNKTYLSDYTQLHNSSDFSLGSFNSSHYKSRISDSSSVLDGSTKSIDENDYLTSSVKSQKKERTSYIREMTQSVKKSQFRGGRESLRRVILKTVTPKPDKKDNINKLSSVIKTDPLNQELSTRLDNPLELSSEKAHPQNLSPNKTSGKLIQKINKAKNISSAQSTSLPLMIDCSVSRDLNIISSSIDSSRVKKRNQANKRRSFRNKLRSSSLAKKCREQLQHLSLMQKKKETTKPHISSKDISISNPQRDSFNEQCYIPTTELLTLLPDDNKSSGKRGRPSGVSAGIEKTPIKQRSCSLPTSKQDVSIANVFVSTGRRGRLSKESVAVDLALRDSITSIVTRRSHTNSSAMEDVLTPKPRATFSNNNKSSGKRGRPSRISAGIEKTPIKKRSRSLHSDTTVNTSKQDVSIADVSVSTGRRGIPSKESVAVDLALRDSITSIVTRHSHTNSSAIEDVSTPKPRATFSSNNKSSEKRGRPSRISAGIEKTPVKKQSCNLHSDTTVNTSKQDVSIANVSVSTGRRGRPSKESVGVDLALRDSITSIVTRHSHTNLLAMEDVSTPKPRATFSSNNNSGKRGRPSRISAGIEKTPIKKRSHSLHSDTTVNTSKQDVSIADVSVSTGRRGRPSKESVAVDLALCDSITSIVTRQSHTNSSAMKDFSTPKPRATFSSNNKSSGERGSPSKVSAGIEKTPVKKRSCSLPSDTTVNTSKQDVSIAEVSVSTGKRGIPSKESVAVDLALRDSITSIVTRQSNTNSLAMEDVSTPKLRSTFSSNNKSSGECGRPSRISAGIEKTPVKKQSCNLHSDTTVNTSKKDVSIANVSVSTGRRGRPSKESVGVDLALRDSITSIVTRQLPTNSLAIEDVSTPKPRATFSNNNKSSGKRGRPSRISAGIEKTPIKKRSRSLHSDTTVNTSKQDVSIADVSVSTGRIGIPSKESVGVDLALRDSITSIVTRHSHTNSLAMEDVSTPKPRATFSNNNKSSGKRGRPSRISAGIEKTPIIKRSHSLHSDTTVNTSKQDVSIADVSVSTGRRGIPSKESVGVDLALRDSITSIVTRHSHTNSLAMEDVSTPKPRATFSNNNKSSGKRGRPSRISAGIEKTPIKKRSHSLHSDTTVNTSKQDVSIADVSVSTGRRGIPSKESVGVDLALRDSITSIVTRHSHTNSLAMEDVSTPKPRATFSNNNKSSGKRGRPSRISAGIEKTPVAQPTALAYECVELSRKISETFNATNDDFSLSSSNLFDIRTSFIGDKTDIATKSVENSFYSAKSSGHLDGKGSICEGIETLISITKDENSSSVWSGVDLISPNESISFLNGDVRADLTTLSKDILVNNVIPISSVSARNQALANPLKEVTFSPIKLNRSSPKIENGYHLVDPLKLPVSHIHLKGRELGKGKVEADPCCGTSRQTAKSASCSVNSLVTNCIENKKNDVFSPTSDKRWSDLITTSQGTSEIRSNNSGKPRKRKLTEEGSPRSHIEDELSASCSPIQKKIQTDDSTLSSTNVIKNIRAKFISLKSTSKGSLKSETPSSTPIVSQNNSILFSSRTQKFNKLRIVGKQSSVGISPIVSSDKSAVSHNDYLVVNTVGLPSLLSGSSEAIPNTKNNNKFLPQHLTVYKKNNRKALKEELSSSPAAENKAGKEVNIKEELESVVLRRGRSAFADQIEKASSVATNTEDITDKYLLEKKKGRPKKVIEEISQSSIPPAQNKGRTTRKRGEEELIPPSQRRGRMALKDQKDLPASQIRQRKGRATREVEKEVNIKGEINSVVHGRRTSAVAAQEENASSVATNTEEVTDKYSPVRKRGRPKKVIEEISQSSIPPAQNIGRTARKRGKEELIPPSQRRGRVALKDQKDLPASQIRQRKSRATREVEKEVNIKGKINSVVQGRRTSAVAAQEENASSVATNTEEVTDKYSPVRKRGRPKKVIEEISQSSIPPAKNIGRTTRKRGKEELIPPSQRRGRMALKDQKNLPASQIRQRKGRTTRKVEKEMSIKGELESVMQGRRRSNDADQKEKARLFATNAEEISDKYSPVRTRGRPKKVIEEISQSSIPPVQNKGRTTRKGGEEELIPPSQRRGRVAFRCQKDLPASQIRQRKGRATRKVEKEMSIKGELESVMQGRRRSNDADQKEKARLFATNAEEISDKYSPVRTRGRPKKVIEEISQSSIPPVQNKGRTTRKGGEEELIPPSQRRGRVAFRCQKDLPASQIRQRKGRATRKVEKEMSIKGELESVMQGRRRSDVADQKEKARLFATNAEEISEKYSPVRTRGRPKKVIEEMSQSS